MSEDRYIDVPPTQAVKYGNSWGFRPPDEWLNENGLEYDDPVYMVPKLDLMEYHKEKPPTFHYTLKIRQLSWGTPRVTIPSSVMRFQGIRKGTRLTLRVDANTGVLYVWNDKQLER